MRRDWLKYLDLHDWWDLLPKRTRQRIEDVVAAVGPILLLVAIVIVGYVLSKVIP